VDCARHGVTVAAVPWARHDARATREFEDTVAWLATRCSKSAVTELMRVTWRTVGSIIARVVAETDCRVDRLEGLRRIGIDEVSYRKGHNYLTVVVDHDTGRLVWAMPGRDEATLERFFDELGDDRSRKLTHVSGDLAPWIGAVVTRRAPQAALCADAFHLVQWAMVALDEVRRDVWNQARRQPGGSSRRVDGPRSSTQSRGAARLIAQSRWALRRNEADLTGRQRHQLAWIAKTSPTLYRAYLLKEGLRLVFEVGGDEGIEILDRWLSWTQRCRIPQFVDLGRRIRRHLPAIHAALTHDLSNARTEAVNTRIRLITRVAFGFHGPQPLIALAMLSLGGYRPPLPGR
jgi:transposase